MLTLDELANEIKVIREVADSITIKGHENAIYITLINNKCTELLNKINEAIQTLQNETKKLTAEPNVSEEG